VEADDDKIQIYTYINESDYPGANRFNVGDKVQLNYEEFAESPYIHTVEFVQFCLFANRFRRPANRWEYWVRFDPNFSHPDPRVQAWIDDKEGVSFFLENHLVSAELNTTVHLYSNAF